MSRACIGVCLDAADPALAEGVVVMSPLLPVIGDAHWTPRQPMIQSKLFHRLMNRLYEFDRMNLPDETHLDEAHLMKLTR
jgi:hypothetical protein